MARLKTPTLIVKLRREECIYFLYVRLSKKKSLERTSTLNNIQFARSFVLIEYLYWNEETDTDEAKIKHNTIAFLMPRPRFIFPMLLPNNNRCDELNRKKKKKTRHIECDIASMQSSIHVNRVVFFFFLSFLKRANIRMLRECNDQMIGCWMRAIYNVPEPIDRRDGKRATYQLTSFDYFVAAFFFFHFRLVFVYCDFMVQDLCWEKINKTLWFSVAEKRGTLRFHGKNGKYMHSRCIRTSSSGPFYLNGRQKTAFFFCLF